MNKFFYTFYISLFFIICLSGYIGNSFNIIIGLLLFICLAILDIKIHKLITRKYERKQIGKLLATNGRNNLVKKLFK